MRQPEVSVTYASRSGSTAGVAESIGETLSQHGARAEVVPMREGVKYRPQVAEWVAPVRGLVRPVCEGLFAGALDKKKTPSFADRIKFRLIVLGGVWSEGKGDLGSWFPGWMPGQR